MVGRPPKYPWNDWFDALEQGGVVSLLAGRDFDHDPRHMQRQVAAEARRRQVQVKTTWMPRARRIEVLRVRRAPSYDWDCWFDGEVHRLLPGIDFRCDVAKMAALARQAGRRRGLLVHTTVKDGTLWLQAFKRDVVLVG